MKWAAIASVILVFLWIDFLTPRMARGDDVDLAQIVLMGVCIGQINLIAAWAALAPGNIAWRLPWSLLLAVLMWYAIVLGLQADRVGSPRDLGVALTVGLVLLVAVAIAQVPLWIAGRVFRWKLVGWSGSPRQAGRGDFQFRLQHLFWGILILSLALAPARTVLPPGNVNLSDLRGEGIVALVIVAVSNLLITVPCIWGAFLARSLLLGVGLVWLAYCALLTAIELGLLMVFLGEPGRPDGLILLVYFLLNLSQCLTVFGTLLIFRALGVRLVRLARVDVSAAEDKDRAT